MHDVKANLGDDKYIQPTDKEAAVAYSTDLMKVLMIRLVSKEKI